MGLDKRIVAIVGLAIFLAVFVLFYIFDNIASVLLLCESDKSFKICGAGLLPIIILVLLLIAGGLIMIINLTIYILMSGTRRALK